MQYVETHNIFHSPGVVYRPVELKNLRVLLGNTEVKTVYQNFELLNLHVNYPDRSHLLYQKYLQTNRFIPPMENNYWEHACTNIVPTEPSKTEGKGAFNIFPVALTSDEMDHSKSSSLG